MYMLDILIKATFSEALYDYKVYKQQFSVIIEYQENKCFRCMKTLFTYNYTKQ